MFPGFLFSEKEAQTNFLLNYLGPDEMHPRVLKALADAVAKPLSMIFERSRQSGEVPGKRETLGPFLKKVERRTLGTTDMSASPLCLGRSWNRCS